MDDMVACDVAEDVESARIDLERALTKLYSALGRLVVADTGAEEAIALVADISTLDVMVTELNRHV